MNNRYFFDHTPITMERHLLWFNRYLVDDDRFDFVIELEDGGPIGTCGISRVGDAVFEASYMIGEIRERGKGYGTEALEAMVALAFEEGAASKVIARIAPGNLASQRVAQKAGLSEEQRIFCIEKSIYLMNGSQYNS